MKRENTDFTSALVADVKGMKIGIPRDYFGEGLDPEVRDAVLAAAEVLKAQGAEVEEFDLSLVDYAIPLTIRSRLQRPAPTWNVSMV